MSAYRQFCTTCLQCGGNTSKAYARAHDGLCKTCTTDVYSGTKCPDCSGPISTWKLSQGYHCDSCTRRADPLGYDNEVRGFYDFDTD